MRIFFFLISAILFISGCEAPLDLDGIDQTRKEALRRYDQFQAATVSKDNIIVVGSDGVVLIVSKTDPDQITRKKVASSAALIDITTCPNNSLIALDMQRKIWMSDDEGQSWRSQIIDNAEVPQAITCDPDNQIWVVSGFSTILNSPDQGESWTTTSLDEDLFLTTIQFIDQNTAYITGEFGTVLKTMNSGEEWEYLNPIANEFYPQDSLFIDESTGWVVGLNGTILKTANGGESWERQETGTGIPFYSIVAAGEKVFVGGENGTVLKLENDAWRSHDHGKPVRFYLRAMAPVGTDKLLIAGGAGALHVISNEPVLTP